MKFSGNKWIISCATLVSVIVKLVACRRSETRQVIKRGENLRGMVMKLNGEPIDDIYGGARAEDYTHEWRSG